MTKKEARRRALQIASGVIRNAYDVGAAFGDLSEDGITADDCHKIQAELKAISIRLSDQADNLKNKKQ